MTSKISDERRELVVKLRRKARFRKIRAAQRLADRVIIQHDGTRLFVRFTRAQQLEHQTLLISFTMLAVTGLLQRGSRYAFAGAIITFLGGIETLRTLHHLAAIVMIAQSVYHFAQILITWFVHRSPGSMWPRAKDLTDLWMTIRHNLGLSQSKPRHDRFSVEEKVEYWALLWGTVLMGITGVIQWFPTTVTNVLPGESIPVARAIHSWEAVLAVLSILIWHGYHTVIKERNRSIFTGTMTEHEMQEAHPLEYERILRASDLIAKLQRPQESGSPPTTAAPQPDGAVLEDEAVLARAEP